MARSPPWRFNMPQATASDEVAPAWATLGPIETCCRLAHHSMPASHDVLSAAAASLEPAAFALACEQSEQPAAAATPRRRRSQQCRRGKQQAFGSAAASAARIPCRALLADGISLQDPGNGRSCESRRGRAVSTHRKGAYRVSSQHLSMCGT